MTQEQKELLLKDLCARLPYGVKCEVFDDTNPYTLSGILHNKPYNQLYFEELDWKECDGFVGVEYCKPYLFPLLSMTEEQKEELHFNYLHNDIDFDDFTDYFLAGELWHDLTVSISTLPELINWLNKHHFDYRGLIPKGLANDATGLNIY